MPVNHELVSVLSWVVFVVVYFKLCAEILIKMWRFFLKLQNHVIKILDIVVEQVIFFRRIDLKKIIIDGQWSPVCLDLSLNRY